jgi:hypothetical protein
MSNKPFPALQPIAPDYTGGVADEHGGVRLLFRGHAPNGNVQEFVARRAALASQRYTPLNVAIAQASANVVEKALAEIEADEYYLIELEETLEWHGTERGTHGALFHVSAEERADVLAYLEKFYRATLEHGVFTAACTNPEHEAGCEHFEFFRVLGTWSFKRPEHACPNNASLLNGVSA